MSLVKSPRGWSGAHRAGDTADAGGSRGRSREIVRCEDTGAVALDGAEALQPRHQAAQRALERRQA